MDEKKKKTGRPPALQDVDLKKVKEFAMAGHTNAEMAEAFHVAESSWYAYKLKNPEFAEALKVGKKVADDLVENALFQSATGYSHPEEVIHVTKNGEVIRVPTVRHYPPNPTAMIFWSKNRQPKKWRDKVEHNHAGTVNQVVRYHKPERQKK